MKVDARTWRAVGSVVLLLVLGLVASRVGGDDTGSADPSVRASSTAPASSSTSPGASSDAVDPETGLAWIEQDDLPDEALEVLRAIDAGGPFDSPDHDGGTFGNYEGALPAQARGYYREYTVPTPGSRSRGARRIVTGGPGPSAYFWTADHYGSFARIRR